MLLSGERKVVVVPEDWGFIEQLSYARECMVRARAM